MTYDPVDVLKRFADRERIGFALLSDPNSSIISAFGLIDRSIPAGSRWHGIAHPMILVVDRDGVVRHRFSEADYRDRPDVGVILEILGKEAKG